MPGSASQRNIHRDTESNRGDGATPWNLILIFVILTAGIVAAGYFYYSRQRAHIKESISEELVTITNLKVTQITNWRKERLGDANVLAENPLLVQLAQNVMDHPQSVSPRQEFSSWMRSLQRNYNYKAILLLEPRGKICFAIGKYQEPISKEVALEAQEAATKGGVLFGDFYRSGANQEVDLDLVVPLTKDIAGRKIPVGAILLRLDPQASLYPLVKQRPIPSSTAESMLLRRDGDQVVYLNELRYRANTTLRLRIPAHQRGHIAARVAQGEEGILEGLDYRGVSVLAAGQRIPESPWILVTKMDVAEVYASINEEVRPVTFSIIAMIFLAGSILGIFWKHQSARFYHQRYMSALEREALTRHYEYLTKDANDIFLLTDAAGKFVEVNDRAAASYGYTRDELLGLSIQDLRLPEERHLIPHQQNEVEQRDGLVYESAHVRKDGSTFPVEVSARCIQIGDRKYYQGIVRDITERKAAEKKIIHLNRIHALLSHIDQVIVHIRDQKLLLEEACRVAVEYGLFSLAWVGVENTDDHWVCPVAMAGKSTGYLEAIKISTSGPRNDLGPTAAAILTGTIQVSNDIGHDPRMLAWKEAAVAQGFRSNIVLPLTPGGRVFGAFSLFATEPNFFSEDEVELLKEVAEDITFALENIEREDRRKETERELAHSRQMLRLILDNIPQCVFWKDIDSRYVGWNKSFLEDAGLKEGESILGKSDFDLAWKEQAEAYQKDDREVIRSGVPYFNVEASRLEKDGTVRWRRRSKIPLRDHEGKVIGILGVFEDITDHKKTEDQLLDTNQLLQALIECSPIAIDVISPDGKVKIWNPAAERLFGWTAAEAVGEHLPTITGEVREQFEQAVLKVKAGESFQDMETRRKRKDGTVVDISLSAAPLRNAVGDVIAALGLITDITKRKRLEEELRQAQKMEAVGRLAGGIAHDFNNLLTAISGYSELLLQQVDASNPMHKQLQEIHKAGERAASLTRQLLAFSRRQILQPKVLDLNAVIEGMQKMLRRMIGEDVDLRFDPCKELGHVKADPGQLEQVLANLVVNARDAMPHGGTILLETWRAEVDAVFAERHENMRAGEYALLTVSDTGVGISPEALPHLFEPFFTTKEQGKGTGLGLSTVYGIVRQSDGTVEVVSEVGKGTTFKIYLPRVEEALEAPTAPPSRERDFGGRETICLVEDEEGVRNLGREVLKMKGYTVLEAANGVEAFELFERIHTPVDLLITDVVMPKMNGVELAKRVASRFPKMKVIFVSGYSEPSALMESHLGSDIPFLQKPFAPHVLVKKVREVLDKS